jgi:hypothetical protein
MPLMYSRPPKLKETLSIRRGSPDFRPVFVMSMVLLRSRAETMAGSSLVVVMRLVRSSEGWSGESRRTAAA